MDRDWGKDLERVCNEIAHSLYRDQDCYDGYSQDCKRPFGNSGGPEHDILEMLDLDHKCPTCGSEEYKGGLEYARELWAAAEKALQRCKVTLDPQDLKR